MSDVLRDALTVTANRGGPSGCEVSTDAQFACRTPLSGRTRDSRYGADQWCEPCLAIDALNRYYDQERAT